MADPIYSLRFACTQFSQANFESIKQQGGRV